MTLCLNIFVSFYKESRAAHHTTRSLQPCAGGVSSAPPALTRSLQLTTRRVFRAQPAVWSSPVPLSLSLIARKPLTQTGSLLLGFPACIDSILATRCSKGVQRAAGSVEVISFSLPLTYCPAAAFTNLITATHCRRIARKKEVEFNVRFGVRSRDVKM